MLLPRVLTIALVGILLPVAAEAGDASTATSAQALELTIGAPQLTNLSAASPTTLAHLPPFLLDARAAAYMVAISRSVTPQEVEASLVQSGAPGAAAPATVNNQGLPACVSASLKLSSKSAVICSPEPASDLAR
ncbi:MAG TPA: hypothetical protein VMU42_18315 [Candidatus Sulfotelmatobacter sp.]|nr:hypothetical protein [Candidatus Sulfotelmatobacter sp.]